MLLASCSDPCFRVVILTLAGLMLFSRGSAADPNRWRHNWDRSSELEAIAPTGGVLLLHGPIGPDIRHFKGHGRRGAIGKEAPVREARGKAVSHHRLLHRRPA